jgi:hypothetical protein
MRYIPEEKSMNIKKITIILAHALIGWALCGATMGIGLATMPLEDALIVHALAAPVFFTGISLVYFQKFNYTTPFQTALIFVGFVMAMDFFVVALLINRSLDMFASLLGTWIPFALIFAAAYLRGVMVRRSAERKAVA